MKCGFELRLELRDAFGWDADAGTALNGLSSKVGI